MTMKDSFGIKAKDYLSDPRIRLLAVLPRLVLVELCAWATRSARPGYLMQYGKALGWTELARLTSLSVEEIREGVAVLMQAGLMEMSRDGTLLLPVIVKAAAKSEKMRINANAGKQPNLFKNNDETAIAEQTPDCAVVPIASATQKPRKPENPPLHPLKNINNNLYIYSRRIPKNAPNPKWFTLSVIKFGKLEYQALLDQLPLTDAQLDALLAKQNRWLEQNSAYQRDWLPVTLAYLRRVTGTGKAVAA